MSKYVKAADGLKSNALGFKYKLNEVNTASNWNPEAVSPKDMGGFNFSTEDKVLRWLHRGDTLYDVVIPGGSDVKIFDEEKGIYRTNKIILSNPQSITDILVFQLYEKSNLSDEIIAQCLLTLTWRDRIEISKYIIKDRVNRNNIDKITEEFKKYVIKVGAEHTKQANIIYRELAVLKNTIINNEKNIFSFSDKRVEAF